MNTHSLLFSLGLAILAGQFCLWLLAYRQCWRAFPLLQQYARKLKSLRYLESLEESTLPPLTLLLVLHDEREQSIGLLKQCLQLEYPRVDYLVVHNGDDQVTFECLREQYGLKPVPRFPVAELGTRPVKGVYQSEDMPQLWVIDKEPGSLPDALNAGLNFCQTPLVAVINPHVQTEPEALLQLSRPFLQNSLTWAVSGRVRFNQVQTAPAKATLPPKIWGKLAVILQQRQNLVQHIWQNQVGVFGNLSPDCVLLRRASLVEAGGFPASGELYMAETAVRLRRLARIQGVPAQVVFLPDTLAWKSAPQARAELKQSVMRFQQIQKMLWRDRTLSKGRWQSFGLFVLEPAWLLLTWASCLLWAWLDPLWLGVWLLAVFSPVAVAAMVVTLGELTSYRYSRPELQRLQNLAWVYPLCWQPLIAWWQILGWFSPPPEPERVQVKKQTSPLKHTARLNLGEDR